MARRVIRLVQYMNLTERRAFATDLVARNWQLPKSAPAFHANRETTNVLHFGTVESQRVVEIGYSHIDPVKVPPP